VSIDAFVEVDIGQGRCGVTDPDAMIALAEQIERCPSLRFAGLQAYHGGIQHIHSWNARREAADIAAATTEKYVRHLDSRGIVGIKLACSSVQIAAFAGSIERRSPWRKLDLSA
jgi:D-serine deaminase-like pyridoxal phosphate-dependent protein